MRKIYFSFVAFLLMLVALPSQAQLSELNGKLVTMGSAATEITADQWYVMQNGGRGIYAYESSSNALMAMATTDITFTGQYATDIYGYLVRFVPVEGQAGAYYIQSGSGNYWGALTEGDNAGTTATADNYFVADKITGYDDWFDFMGNNGEMVLDCNAAGSTVAGWGTDLPSTNTSNAAWQILPATLTDESDLIKAEITYNYVMDGQVQYSYTQTQRGPKTGFEVVFDAPKARYGTKCDDSKASETITEDKTYEVTYTYVMNPDEPLPFETTPIDGMDFPEGTKWYYLSPFTGASNYAYSSAADNYVSYQKLSTHPIDLHYMFCFSGTPLKGYRIHNCMNYASTSVDASETVEFTDEGADYYLVAGYNGKGFSFNLTTNENTYLNAYNSQLTTYTSANYAYSDGGSAFDITAVTDEEYAQATEGVLASEATPADGSVFGEGESLEQVQLVFTGEKDGTSDRAVAIVAGMETGKITLTDADGNVVATPTYAVSKAALNITFSPALTDAGKYYLNIPAGLVKGATTGLPNQAILLTYTFTGPFVEKTVTARMWKGYTNEFRTYTCWEDNFPYAKHADSDTEYYTCKVRLISNEEVEFIDWEGIGDETDVLDFKYDPTVEFTSKSTHNGKTVNDAAYYGAYNFSDIDTKLFCDGGSYVITFVPTYSNCRIEDGYGQAQLQFLSGAYDSYFYLCFDWYTDDRYANAVDGKIYSQAFKELGYTNAEKPAFTQLPYGEDGTYDVAVQVQEDTITIQKYDGESDIALGLGYGGVMLVNGNEPSDGYTNTWVTSSVLDGMYGGWYCYLGFDQEGKIICPASWDDETKSGYVVLQGYDYNVPGKRYIYIALGNYQPELDTDGVKAVTAGANRTSKLIRDRHVVIVKDGKEYTATGQRMK